MLPFCIVKDIFNVTKSEQFPSNFRAISEQFPSTFPHTPRGGGGGGGGTSKALFLKNRLTGVSEKKNSLAHPTSRIAVIVSCLHIFSRTSYLFHRKKEKISCNKPLRTEFFCPVSSKMPITKKIKN